MSRVLIAVVAARLVQQRLQLDQLPQVSVPPLAQTQPLVLLPRLQPRRLAQLPILRSKMV